MSEDKPPKFGSYESSVLRNLKASNSVRTTVPQVIAAQLGSAPGTTLIWSFDPSSKSAVVKLKPGPPKRKSSKRD
jgi:hypothetical protein